MTTTSTAQPRTAGLWESLHRWIRWLKIGVYTITGLFFFILLAEAVRLHALAADVHPILGYATILLMLAGLLLIALPVYRFLRVPRALTPPHVPPPEAMRLSDIHAEIRFLDRYLSNCSRNPEFADRLDDIATAQRELTRLRGKTAAGDVAALDEELGHWAGTTMSAILADVDARAERLIYQEALAVGVGTAVSPNGTLDAFVMLWRSVNVASKLATLYYGRPGPLGTLAICRDVSIATVSAVYLDKFSDSLAKILTKAVGGVAGVVAGPAVEGVTNALVLIRIGYLAKGRCRSFRQWNQSTQTSALLEALAATQKVTVGLTTEIFRQAGSGLGAVAESAARNIAQAAGAAAQGLGTAAGSAWSAAAGLGGKIGATFTANGADPETAAETKDPG